jgi:hypothetical protein
MRVVAIDIHAARCPSDRLARTQRSVDFLRWSTQTNLRFDRIIANPPFLSLRRIDGTMLESALQIDGPHESRVTANSNSWYAFLCASLKLLKRGGHLGFILPAAWDYADYASPLRERISSFFTSVEVHRCWKPLFNDVQDGSIVLIARDYGGHSNSIRRFESETVDDLLLGLERCSLGVPNQAVDPTPPESADICKLGDIIEIRLGGVTGDADYFLLSETTREKWELPEQALVPVVSKSRHLIAPMLQREHWNRLRASNERIWLFRPPENLKRNHFVKRYLNLPVRDGGCHRSRYKVACRKPWYKTPLPQKCHGFMSGMPGELPWLSLRAMRNLSASNTLYVITFREMLTIDARCALAIQLISTNGAGQLDRVRRRYPAGLGKFEPGDLQRLSVMRVTKSAGALAAYKTAVRHVLDGDMRMARSTADDWIGRNLGR